MADIVLSDKREITIDLYKMTLAEYDLLFIPSTTEDERRSIIAKTMGMNLDQLNALPMPDGLLTQREFWRKCREPLADPNSDSASTSV